MGVSLGEESISKTISSIACRMSALRVEFGDMLLRGLKGFFTESIAADSFWVGTDDEEDEEDGDDEEEKDEDDEEDDDVLLFCCCARMLNRSELESTVLRIDLRLGTLFLKESVREGSRMSRTSAEEESSESDSSTGFRIATRRSLDRLGLGLRRATGSMR